MKRFAQQWILSCSLYLIVIFCIISFFSIETSPVFYLLVNVLGIYILNANYKACCIIEGIPYNKFWDLYPLFLITFGIVISLLIADTFIIGIAFSAYQLIITTVTVYIVLRKWRTSNVLKLVSAFSFFICGIFQIVVGFAIAVNQSSIAFIYLSICVLLILNFTFTFVYNTSIRQQQFLREDYLQILAEKSVDIIFYYVVYPYPRFAFISPSIENMLGYKRADFYVNPAIHLELTHEEDRDIMNKAFSPEAVSITKDVVRWQKKDGDYIYLEFHNTPIFSGNKLIAIEGIFRDVTDKKIVEQEMIDSRRSRQLLLSYISHELKTPITYIVGYAEALQKNLFEDDEERENSVNLILAKALFLQKLIEDLFQLSKMESNQFSFEFMQVKVYDLFSRLHKTYRSDVINAKMNYSAHIDEALKSEQYEVLVDVKRIEQVHANIIHNAIKYSPENSAISYSCNLDEKKERVIFSIRDNGTGIAREDLPYIFTKFYRGKGAAVGSKGSGLGLSLSHQIIQAHKGEISVKSNKGKGSIFSFTIPLYHE